MSTEVQGPPPEATESDDIASEAALGAPEVIADSLGEYVKIWISRVRNGESGALPVILGLVAIVIYFQARSSLFLSAGNLVNLTTQAAFIIMLGMAEVFVLLLGEIDLSIGYTSALGATFTCWLLLPPNPAPWPLAVLVGLAVPAIFSGLEGVMVTRLRLPSFVVTLAGQLLAFGLLLEVMNSAAPSGGGSTFDRWTKAKSLADTQVHRETRRSCTEIDWDRGSGWRGVSVKTSKFCLVQW